MREDVVQGMDDAVLEQPTVFRVVVRWQEWSRVSLSPRRSRVFALRLVVVVATTESKFRSLLGLSAM